MSPRMSDALPRSEAPVPPRVPRIPFSAADVSITPVMRSIGSPLTITPSSTRTSVTYLVMSKPASGSTAAWFASAGTRDHEPPAFT